MSRADHAASDAQPATSTPNGAVSHTSASAPLSLLFRALLPRFVVSILNIPRSLWRVLHFQDPPDATPPDDHLPHSLVGTLSSSRPAPPSPAVSRRTSGLSRASSRPISGISSRASSRPVSDAHSRLHPSSTSASPSLSRHTHPAVLPMTPTVDSDPTPTPTPTLAVTPVLIHIRDYGFAPTDPRFTGLGPNIPRANRPAILARRLAPFSESSSASSSASDYGDDASDDYEDVDEDEEGAPNGARTSFVFSKVWEDVVDDDGWTALKWGFDRVWSFGRPASMTFTDATTPTTSSSAGGFPSRGDLDRNFGGEEAYEESVDMDVDETYLDGNDDDDDDDDGDDIAAEGDYDAPLTPGLYRALYAFEPEGTAEMKLDEDQLVRVIGRGGGVGWAVVVKESLKDTGVHALVPESYLEPVRLDGEDEDA